MSAKINRQTYGRLLAKRLPRVVSTDEEHARMMADVEALMRRGAQMSVEERELMRLMVTLLEDYETRRFSEEEQESSPLEILEHLMDVHGHTAKDLWDVLADKGTVSKILSGEREISKAQAKRLAAFYKVSPSLFI